MIFKNRNPKRSLYRGIIAMIAGGAIVFVPELTLKIVIQSIGVLLLFDGIINILIRTFSKKKQGAMLPLIPRGIPNVIFGIILLAFPTQLVEFFVFVIGLILVIAGGSQLSSQITGGRKLGFSLLYTLIGLIAFLSGIVLLFKPFNGAEAILTFFGIVVVLYGLGEIVWYFKMNNYQKTMKMNEVESTVDAEYEEIE